MDKMDLPDPKQKNPAGSHYDRREAQVGLVLVDVSFKSCALDKGAAAILRYPKSPGTRPEPLSYLPTEVVEHIRRRKGSGSIAQTRVHFRVGPNEYVCRPYLMEFQNGLLPHSMLALHLEKLSSGTNAISDIALQYQLTEREQEALLGISLGLTTKEVALRMGISPNTVKAFLRLIMIKMGVTTRSGIVAKLLQNQTLQELDETLDERVRSGKAAAR
jgi:DNA-binding CsgD family transcriptional regulator